jgi:hypothetical protein
MTERETDAVKGFVIACLALTGMGGAFAQEIELPPIVVTGTFELRPGPSVTDLFTLHLQKQIETKRAVEETVARSPWYYSRYWNYVPMKFGSSSPDPDQFFKPRYLMFEYQKDEWELRKAEKKSLFERR